MKDKLMSLQALRALAFMGIFLFHAGIIWGNFGGLGSSIFIVLSGFLMTYTYYDRPVPDKIKDAVTFSMKKIRKLYPLHIITMTIILLGLVLLALKNHEVDKAYILRMLGYTISNVLLIQSYIPIISVNVSLNGVAWYLCVTVFLYFAFPFVLRIIKKYKTVKSAYVAMVILYFIQIFISFITRDIKGIDGNFHTWITYCCPLFRLLDFSIGCNLGYIFLMNRKDNLKDNEMVNNSKISLIVYSLLELICFGLAPFLVYWSQKIYSSKIANTFTPTTIVFLPISVLLVFLFASNKGIISILLTKIKPIIILGDLSPYMFLIHFAVIFVISKIISFLSLGLNKYIITFIYFLFTVISSKVYEEFGIKRKKNTNNQKNKKS